MDFLAVTKLVTNIINDTAIADIHTHLYSEAFGDLLLWGIDDLLTYHYLVPELFRLRSDLEPKAYFKLSKREKAAGCMVRDGRITSRGRARVERDSEVVYEGSLSSLKRFQNDASEVREGQECGIRLDNFSDYKEGDIIEVYEMERLAQEL